MVTIADFSSVRSATAGNSAPECIKSPTVSSKRRPKLPAGWLNAKSSEVNRRALSNTIANASPSANTAVVLEVGARLSGQASCDTAA